MRLRMGSVSVGMVLIAGAAVVAAVGAVVGARATRIDGASDSRSGFPPLPSSDRPRSSRPPAVRPGQAPPDRPPRPARPSTAACCCSSPPTTRPSRGSRSPTARRPSRSSASTWRAGRRTSRDVRRRRPRLPARSARAAPEGHLHRPGPAPPLRDLPPRGRPHGQAAHGPRRRPAVEPRARQPLQHAAQGRDRSRRGRDDRDRARPGHPAHPAARRRRSTSSTSASRASASRSSGDGRCTSARTCCCRRASTSAPRRAIPLVINHGHFPATSTASAKSRPTRT